MTAELKRVTTAEAAWMEIFAWARGLHPDMRPPSSNEELDTRYAQLARAPRNAWEGIMHTPIQQVEKLERAGELNASGEPIVSPEYSKTHCDDLVEAVRIHEAAHRDFFLSPGNFLEGGLMASRRFRLRSESEVVSYRTHKEFLTKKLDALKKLKCGYRASGQDGPVIYSGYVCDLEKPFTLSGTVREVTYNYKFTPASATAGTATLSLIYIATFVGNGPYTIDGIDSGNPRITWRVATVISLQGHTGGGSGIAHINLTPLDTDECSTRVGPSP